jgi:hypothetical protein
MGGRKGKGRGEEIDETKVRYQAREGAHVGANDGLHPRACGTQTWPWWGEAGPREPQHPQRGRRPFSPSPA